MGSPLLWFGDGVKFLRNILRFADEQGELKAIDQNNTDKNSLIYIDPTSVGLYVLDDSDSALDARIELQDNGNITQKGAIILFSKDYAANETALVGGYSKHVFTSVPAGNVVVTTALNGAEFTLANESGSNFTIEGNTTETFNGAATFVIEDGQNYKFIEAGYGEYTILQKATSSSPTAGSVVQVKYVQNTAATANSNTQIPFDGTKPQNTEGLELMTLAITPTSATNRLVFVATAVMASSNADRMLTLALFQDSTASALAATTSCVSAASLATTVPLQYSMISGTTSATTFKLRGGNSAGTWTFNGSGGAGIFDGVCISSLTIYEIQV